ncbi:MAG: hypothetical protein JO314_04025 [Acidobacteria bacterium]|nr:hypothetical protein [Acidobacteriota bacterium]
MKRYVLSHIRGSIELFCLIITTKVVWDIVLHAQSNLDRFGVFVWACFAFAFGFTRWPLFDSDEALLRVTPDRTKQ